MQIRQQIFGETVVALIKLKAFLQFLALKITEKTLQKFYNELRIYPSNYKGLHPQMVYQVRTIAIPMHACILLNLPPKRFQEQYSDLVSQLSMLILMLINHK